MNFITGFPKTVKQHDSIMVIADRLINVAHFISLKYTFSVSDVAHVFIKDVVRLHGVSKKLCQIGMRSSLPSFGRSYL